MKEYMVVIFDLGRVILDFDPRDVTRPLTRISGKPEKQVCDVVFGGSLESLYDRGKITSRDFYERVIRCLNVDMTFEQFRRFWTEIFTVKQDVCDIIQAVRDRHKLLLLSNTNEMHFEYAFDRFDVLRLFDDYVLSYRVGERKPHPTIYAAALQKAGCAPGDCVYVDDMEEYVAAARQFRMQALVFRDAPQLEKSLRRLSVLD
jgi:HAD superfamily hydrolase (TIGR01509 family)